MKPSVSISRLMLLCAVPMVSCSDEAVSPAVDGSRPDVILITIDTIRGDALGYAGGARARTPFMDRLANEGVGYLNAHAHSTVTLPSHANIITGQLPWQHGVRDNANFRLEEDVPTIGHMLRDEGYATGAVVGAFPLDRRFGLDRGFDLYDDIFDSSPSGSFEMGDRTAEEVLAKGIEWWRQNSDKPRLLWLHFYDPHFPYAPPGTSGSCGEDCYYDEITYVDSAMQRWLDPILEEEDDLVLVVTGDHGEALGDHGEMTHGVFAYEEVLKVPLLVWDRNAPAVGLDDRFVRHIDIVPTILDRVGAKVPDELPGESLLTLESDRDTYFESLNAWYTKGWAPLVGLIHERHKYIDLPLPELYDLETDPRELQNLYGEKRRLMFRMREILAEAAPADLDDPNRKVTDEEAATLLSLGYVTGGPGDSEITVEDDPKNLIQYDTMLHEALALYENGDVGAAIDKVRRLIALQPEMEVAHDTLAVLLEADNRPKDAIEALMAARKRGDDSPKLARRLGILLSEAGRHEEAIEILSVYDDSSDPDLRNAYGGVLRNVGRHEEAVEQFEAALRIDETNAEALQNLGIVELDRGNLAQAERRLREALALDGSLAAAWNALGVIQMRKGHHRDALASWKKATDLDPLEFDALLNLGRVAGGLGEIAIAREALTRFVETAPPALYREDIIRVRSALVQLEKQGASGG